MAREIPRVDRLDRFFFFFFFSFSQLEYAGVSGFTGWLVYDMHIFADMGCGIWIWRVWIDLDTVSNGSRS